MSELRPYQTEALTEVHRAWSNGLRRVGVSLPTGTGKTHVMAHLAKVHAKRDHRRVLFLLHRDQLVEQTEAKLRATLDPTTSVGVVKGPRNEMSAHVIVASVHSLRSPARRAMLPPISVCVVDEAHVSVSSTYLAVFDQIGAWRADGALLAGFTATWLRADNRGLGDVWQKVVYERDIRWAIANGFLVPPRGIQVGDALDTSGVAVSRATGDYQEKALGEAVMVEDLRDTVVRGIRQHAGSRAGVLFAPTIASADYFAGALNAAGIRTAGIYAHTSAGDRRRLFAEQRAGTIQFLSTCTALAEGWDAPFVSVAAMVRPTRSIGLFVQQVGRVLRPWPTKSDALVLDFVGVTDDLKLRAAVDLSVTRIRDDLSELPPRTNPEPEGRESLVRKITATKEVSLFAGTSVQWLQTRHGVPFVPAGAYLVFLAETARGWNVGQCSNYTSTDGRWLYEGLSSGEALERGSEVAEDLGGHVASKGASWRRGRPQRGQVAKANSLGLDIDGLTAGEVSDKIAVHQATSVLHPVAVFVYNERQTAAS